MAERPTQRGVRSKQNAVLRYLISTDLDTTARDLGVSTAQLRRFLTARPETVRKSPERFSKILAANPSQAAREHDRKLIQRLSGKRLRRAEDRYKKQDVSERLVKAVRFERATRTARKIEEKGRVRYVPVKRTEADRREIVNLVLRDVSGYNVSRIREQLSRGELTESEARAIVEYWRQVYKKADISYERYFGE